MLLKHVVRRVSWDCSQDSAEEEAVTTSQNLRQREQGVMISYKLCATEGASEFRP